MPRAERRASGTQASASVITAMRVIRLNPTGRAGLEASLRDPDTALMSAEAIGLSFPFALPLAFAESLLGGPFPDEGWWALVKRLERTTRPDFLAAVHEFRDAHGEVKRLTDESAKCPVRSIQRQRCRTTLRDVKQRL